MLLTLDHFAPLVGEEFRFVHGAIGEQSAELIDASARGGPDIGGRRPFSLLFQGPVEQTLEQRTYRVRHPAFEELELFIVPVSQGPSGIRYEAVFN